MTRKFSSVKKPGARRNKFGAVRTNGYASKLESAYADFLAEEVKAGRVTYWLEQVPIKLTGTKHVVDFLVFFADGSHRFIEVKGKETALWKLKVKMIEIECPEVYSRYEVVR